nr:hypothetical protein Iba_chr06cCG18090 [Ipomoea batatas]
MLRPEALSDVLQMATAAGSAMAVVSSDLQQRHCGRIPAVELYGAAALEPLISEWRASSYHLGASPAGGEGLPSTLPLNRGACHRRRRGVAHSYRCCRCLVERKPMTGRPGPPCCSAIASRKEERRGRNREEERRNAAARVSSSPPSATEKQGKRPSPSPSTRKGGSPVDALVAVAAWELHRRNPRCSCLGLLSPLTHNYRHCRNHGSKLHRRRRRTEKEENILACWDGRSPLPSSGTAVAPTSLKRARKLHLDGVLHYLLLYRERRRE